MKASLLSTANRNYYDICVCVCFVSVLIILPLIIEKLMDFDAMQVQGFVCWKD